MRQNIVLIGLSGSGKTTVGMLLAQALGRQFLDTDALIAAEAGRSVAEVFTEVGEPAFRELEAVALTKAMCHQEAVIATGGGIVETPANAATLREATVVWLTARAETLAARLAPHADRPLLKADPLTVLRSQGERRAARYAELADWVLATDHLSPTQAADELRRFDQSAPDRRGASHAEDLVVTTPGGDYEVVVADGALSQLPARLARLATGGRVWIVSDDRVWPLHGPRLCAVLETDGIAAQSFQIPAGESSKNLAVVARVYDWLLGGGVERGDLLLAFGGGVVGDIAGLVASTVLRGIGFVQLPTNILAMVDSAIGGKTGVDHAAGKNLIGTFYQPRLVLADTSLLRTLPLAERRAGWAEAIKHGVIANARLFADLVAYEPALRALEEPATSDLLRRAAGIKVAVVSGDEREQSTRMLLNYGHTIGHALEHWSNYAIRHGEAVAIGMGVAATLGRRAGLCDATVEQKQQDALLAFGLPVRIPAAAEPRALLQAARSDKKARQQRLRWVLPTAIGAATVRADIEDSLVLEALEERMKDRKAQSAERRAENAA